ncbi:unannotated protein [freshwater metagenome]|uniref:Unannotated protein n=1 Tax=freshwater metagenome TaxID=449393 RepID=A0A6J6NPD5_9ZZZZ
MTVVGDEFSVWFLPLWARVATVSVVRRAWGGNCCGCEYEDGDRNDRCEDDPFGPPIGRKLRTPKRSGGDDDSGSFENDAREVDVRTWLSKARVGTKRCAPNTSDRPSGDEHD